MKQPASGNLWAFALYPQVNTLLIHTFAHFEILSMLAGALDSFVVA